MIRRFRRVRGRSGFSLVEAMIAMLIVSIGVLATLTMLTFSRKQNDFEQERARAHQIVSEELELAKFDLYPRLRTGSDTTVWDNGTPADPNDDTLGRLDVIVRDPRTGVQLFAAPVPARLVEVEVTLRWRPRGAMGGDINDPTGRWFRETIVTLVAP